MEPLYWKNRLFRNTFTSNGSRFKVNHWSVKIQHLGTRKTFSLRSANRLRAAAEACQLFRTIVQQGWEVALSRHNGREMRAPLPGHNNDSSSNRPEIENWAERLIHRKYTEKFHPNLEREFSARIQHSGTGYYFPLGTDDRKVAAARAMRIHQNVVRKGWES